MHTNSEGRRPKQCGKEAGVADHQVLNIQLRKQDDPEPEILEWSMEDVELATVVVALLTDLVDGELFDVAQDWNLIEHATIDHVKEVHHDKALEEERLVLHTIGRCIFGYQLCTVEIV